MMSACAPQRSDVSFQERLILHYSKMADWLDTRSWYRDDSVVDFVRSLIPANASRVLELCCGTGLLLETLSNSFPSTDFIGVDISPGMVERAQARLSDHKNVRILKQDWIYGFSSEWDRAFDVVIVKNALHLLDDVTTKLGDLERVSRSCTTLIAVETISPNAEANKFIQRLFRIVDSDHIKQAFFTERTLTTALEQAGWQTQSGPRFVRQHIETEDWLKQKCKDQFAFANARRLLSETRNQRIRHAMDFDTSPGMMPSRMLRLQYLARHLFAPTFALEQESHNTDLAQLNLL